MSISATPSRIALCSAHDRRERGALERLDRGRLAVRAKIVRPLQAEFLAVHRAVGRQLRVQRRAAQRAARRAPRSATRSCSSARSSRSRHRADRRARCAACRSGARRTATDPCRDRRRDPVRHHEPGAAGGRDAGGEAAGDEEIVDPLRDAHHRLAVGRHRDRAVDHGADADLVQHRHALGRGLGDERRAGRGFRRTAPARNPSAACRGRSPRWCRSSQPPIASAPGSDFR